MPIILCFSKNDNSFLKKDFIYLFILRERERAGEKEGEEHQCVVASCVPPARDLARNPGMCPDWELNQGPCGLQADRESTEPHQQGFLCFFLMNN